MKNVAYKAIVRTTTRRCVNNGGKRRSRSWKIWNRSDVTKKMEISSEWRKRKEIPPQIN